MFIRNWLRILKCYYYKYKVTSKCQSVGRNLKVNGLSSVFGKVSLGDNVNFNGISIRGVGECKIGNNFHSGTNCIVLTSNHNYNGTKIPYDETMIEKSVIIEDQVWIGDNVLIIGNALLGEGCIIQAGSVVTGKIPPYSIAGGNPAKVFKTRDIDLYNQLKRNKKFK